MTIELVVFIIALALIIFIFKNFNASIYFIVMVDIFLRLVTYLFEHYLRADTFSFLESLPSSLLEVVNSFSLGILNEIFVAIYIAIYIIFEVLLIRFFIKRKF